MRALDTPVLIPVPLYPAVPNNNMVSLACTAAGAATVPRNLRDKKYPPLLAESLNPSTVMMPGVPSLAVACIKLPPSGAVTGYSLLPMVAMILTELWPEVSPAPKKSVLPLRSTWKATLPELFNTCKGRRMFRLPVACCEPM